MTEPTKASIAIVCPVFPPEPAPAGIMAMELGQRFSADGFKVTVFTQFPNRPHGQVYTGYRRALRFIEDMAGIEVVRCPNWLLDPKRRPLNRLLENATFGFFSAFNLLRHGKPDVLVVETWPFFAVQMIVLVGALWRIPVVYYVQDCYPEALLHTNVLKSGSFLAAALFIWDRLLCLLSWRVIAISHGMKAILCSTRGLPAEKVAVIYNWVDVHRFYHEDKWSNWRKKNNIGDALFVAMFSGTMGFVSGVNILLSVARLLTHRCDIVIVCVGDGILKADMVEAAENLKLTNIVFFPVQPEEELCEMFSSANAMLLTTEANYPDVSVPSKLVSYLASGHPIVCSSRGDSTVAKIVLESGSGIVTASGDAAAMAAAICVLADDSLAASEMGKKGRQYCALNLTLERAYGGFRSLLQPLLPGPH
jgi:colanic acid biosynthesis glycosyl transferase WcaI